jgi:LAS superfamily LD-carboxypeptidase LdcB
MINMSRSKKQKDPIRTLIRGMIFLAVAAAVCAAVFYGLNAFEKHTLDQKKKDTQAINQKREQDYSVALAEYQSATQKGQNLNWPSAKPEGWDVIDLSNFPLENTQSVPYDRASLLVGGMMLVNPWHALPADFPVEGTGSVYTKSDKKVKASNVDVKLFQPAIDALKLAMQDAATAGIKELFVDEGYRTNEYQKELFDNKMKSLEDQFSGDVLYEQTRSKVNEPGTSEYQSGFSFTMGIYPNPNKLRFQDSDQGKWFIDNCWKYGFIFRFPARDYPNSSWIDKSYKTGVTITLNLYRWVGAPHATVMKQLDLCMEEYVEYLIQHPHIAVYENGTLKYEIFRKQVGNEATVNIDVPLAASYHLASLDNMGGVVTAFVY